MAVVRILGIDPGTQVVGYGCLELPATVTAAGPGKGRPLAMRGSNVVRAATPGSAGAKLVDAGVLRLGDRRVSVPARLLSLAQQLADLLRSLSPTEVAVEEAFFGKSVQAALRIGEARGVVLAEAARAGMSVHQYTPARIKRCVTGNGSARKGSVARMLAQLLPDVTAVGRGDLPEDATDALAVAWTRLEELRSPLTARGERRSGGAGA